jgi:hypothetical protein
MIAKMTPTFLFVLSGFFFKKTYKSNAMKKGARKNSK